MQAWVARGALLAGFLALHAGTIGASHAVFPWGSAAFFVCALLWAALASTRTSLVHALAALWTLLGLLHAGASYALAVQPSTDAVWMLVSSPAYAWHMLRHVGSVGAYAAAAALLYAGSFWSFKRASLNVPRAGWIVGVAGALVLLWRSPSLPSELAVLRLGGSLWAERDARAEREPPNAAERVALRVAPQRGRAVVWLIHESLRPDAPAPRLPEGRSYVYYAHAYAQSTQTPVSVPSMLTGLGPDDSRSNYARAPLAWHHFDADGERTVFVSPQLYAWSNLDHFYFGSRPPAFVRTAESLRAAPVNDGGVADREAVDAALDLAERVWLTQQELYLFVQFNASHLPCWHPDVAPGTAHYEASPARDERCRKAAAYVRSEEARLLQGLQQRGVLPGAWILSTSDHAEVADGEAPGRAYDVRETFTHVPMWVSPPAGWAGHHRDAWATLQENAREVVGNTDLLPSVLEALGLPPAAGAVGHSLLHPLPAARVQRACIGVPLRAWDRSLCIEQK